MAESKGEQAVLVNFWATWCAPCVEEFPMMMDLAGQLADSGLTTYFVSVDFIDERERVVEFLTSQGVTGLSFLKDEKDMPFINGIDENWTGAVPYTVVFGRKDGKVSEFWEGQADSTKFNTAARRGLYN
ncbi:MAG: TlpA family protein disulfide reductase [Candidatus Marinimicrobia bacterium]|nr:TlpA family protein disulfide reductase [Candidatus Neomarinimicrobiota bacterium]